LERKGAPTFPVIIEMQSKNALTLHHDVAKVMDAKLAGKPYKIERRWVKHIKQGDKVITLKLAQKIQERKKNNLDWFSQLLQMAAQKKTKGKT